MGAFNDTRSLFQTRGIQTCPDGKFSNFSGVFLPDYKHYELRRGYYAAVSLVDKQVSLMRLARLVKPDVSRVAADFGC